MTPELTPLLTGFIGLGITILAVGVSLAALVVTLHIRSEKRTEARIDRLETELKREMAQMRAETNQRFESQEGETKRQFERQEGETKRQFEWQEGETKRQFERQEAETKRLFERQEDQTNQRFGEVKEQFAALDERIRGLEGGQARLAAELSLLKDLFTHFLRPEQP